MGCDNSTEETLDFNSLSNNKSNVKSDLSSVLLTEKKLKEASCKQFQFRLLEKDDYTKGFLDVLGDLTLVHADQISQ